MYKRKTQSSRSPTKGKTVSIQSDAFASPGKKGSPTKKPPVPSHIVPSRTPLTAKENLSVSFQNSSSLIQENYYNPPTSYPQNENMYGSGMNNYSEMNYSAAINPGVYVNDYGDGESVRVAFRVRPMNNMELSRGDQNIIRTLNETTCQLNLQ